MVAWTRRQLLVASALLTAGCSSDRVSTADEQRASTVVRNWTTAGYDIANTGRVPGAGNLQEHARDWRFEVDNRADILATPLVLDGAVYAGSGQTIYGFSLDDGTRRWATETEYHTGILSGTVAGGLLLMSGLAHDGGALLALEPEAGGVEWRHPIAVSTAPTVVDGRAYLGTTDAERALTAIDVASGDEVWSVSFEGGLTVSAFRSAPAVNGETIYTTTSNTSATASSTVVQAVGTDGTKQWGVPVAGEVNAAPAVDDSTVYLGTSEGTLHALDAETGDTRWSTAVSGSVYSSPAVDDNHVYLGTLDDTLYAFDGQRGTKTWETRASVLNTDPAVSDGKVYIGGAVVQARDKDDGTELWSYDMHSWDHTEFTSPAVVNGRLVVGVCAKRQRPQARYDNFVLAVGGGNDASG